MIKHYYEDTVLYNSLSKEASNGNEDAIEFIEMLTLSYNDANLKFGEQEIKSLIYTYYISVKSKKSYDEITKQMDSINLKTQPL